MSGITILSSNRSLEATFVSMYGKDLAIRRVWSNQWRDPGEMTLDACAADPELLIIGSDLSADMARFVVWEVDRRFRGVTTVVLVHDVDIDHTMDLLRLGARDVQLEDPSLDRFKANLDPVIQLARDRHTQSKEPESGELRRRVITTLSPKGGTGKTTVSTNLAVGLARRMPNQVLLLDLDLQFGDCSTALGLRPEHSLLNAVKSTSFDRTALKVFLAQHESGLLVLAPPDDLVAADNISPDDLKHTISALAEEFPFVIIDTAAGIDSAAIAAMEIATDFLFVSTTDIPSIRAIQRQMTALDTIGFASQHRSLVINRANARVGLSAADVENSLGLEAKFQIPSNRLIPVSTNEGVPAVMKDKGNLSRKFDEIARHFAPPSEQSPGRSLLRNLNFSRPGSRAARNVGGRQDA